MHPAIPRLYHWLTWKSGHAMREAMKIRKPRILTYHAIGPGDTPAEIFDWQLRLVRDYFEPVSLNQMIERVEAGRCTGREVAVTFDDGVRNHATTAYPMLREHGIPATFFLCPGLVESGRWVWNMELRLRLRLLGESDRTRLARALGAISPDVEVIIGCAKELELEQREDLEMQARAATSQFDPCPAQLDRFAPMSWEQVCALDPALVTLGSHTLTHPILTTLTPQARAEEIIGSKSLLEHRTGRGVELFCYPNGGLDAATVELVSQCYRAAVSTRTGFVESPGSLHRLPRVHAGQRQGLFMRRLHRPGA